FLRASEFGFRIFFGSQGVISSVRRCSWCNPRESATWEIRNPKVEIRKKSQVRNPNWPFCAFALRVSEFLRASEFGFRIFLGLSRCNRFCTPLFVVQIHVRTLLGKSEIRKSKSERNPKFET